MAASGTARPASHSSRTHCTGRQLAAIGNSELQLQFVCVYIFLPLRGIILRRGSFFVEMKIEVKVRRIGISFDKRQE
jgi:hypothetical protein